MIVNKSPPSIMSVSPYMKKCICFLNTEDFLSQVTQLYLKLGCLQFLGRNLYKSFSSKVSAFTWPWQRLNTGDCITIYDKRDDFNFKIINFPNMCSNIPASPAYGVYISQLIRYARASSNYSDFLKRHLHLRNRLLDQGYTKIRLIRSLKKFIFRYQDLVEIYSVSAEKIINDGFSYSENV